MPPNMPGLVKVIVPPCTSSGRSLRSRARDDTSAIARAMPASDKPSASRTTGTISSSVSASATAMPRLMCGFKTMASPTTDALKAGKARTMRATRRRGESS